MQSTTCDSNQLIVKACKMRTNLEKSFCPQNARTPASFKKCTLSRNQLETDSNFKWEALFLLKVKTPLITGVCAASAPSPGVGQDEHWNQGRWQRYRPSLPVQGLHTGFGLWQALCNPNLEMKKSEKHTGIGTDGSESVPPGGTAGTTQRKLSFVVFASIRFSRLFLTADRSCHSEF